mgnify:CR=1 FL=1
MMPKTIAKLAALPDGVQGKVRDMIVNEILVERETNANMVESCYTLTTGEANKLAARIRGRAMP